MITDGEEEENLEAMDRWSEKGSGNTKEDELGRC